MTEQKTDNSDSKNTPAVEAPIEAAPQAVPATVVKKSSSGAAGVAVIFSVAAMAASGFTWYQNQVSSVRSESSLAVGVSNIGGQVSRLGDSITQLQTQQNKVVSPLNRKRVQLSNSGYGCVIGSVVSAG